MKILVINDDGIKSAGLWAAVRALRRVGEVFVVAPAQEQSGVGASLTLHSAVRVTPWTPDAEFQETGEGAHPVTAYAAEGTPGDCCILALETLTTGVDLVVSGINSGSNVGWDVMVSGTVGGAVQGFNRGPLHHRSIGRLRYVAALRGRRAGTRCPGAPAGWPGGRPAVPEPERPQRRARPGAGRPRDEAGRPVLPRVGAP